MCNYCYALGDLNVRWIHQALLVRPSADGEVITDVMFRVRASKTVLGIVQAGLVLASDIEIIQESLLNERDKYNQLVQSKDDYAYEIQDVSRRILKVRWGRDVKWAPLRESKVLLPSVDGMKIRTWPDIHQLTQMMKPTFPQVSESNFQREFEDNHEFRKCLLDKVPYTKIEISGFGENEGSQIVRLKWRVRDLAYAVPESSYVYKIYGPENIWTKLHDKIRLLESAEWREQFESKYHDSVTCIQAPVYDLEILIDPSLCEVFHHGHEYEKMSHLVMWPFSELVPAWSHFFSFMPDNQDFFIEMKALSLFPAIEKSLIELDSSSVLKHIRKDQIEELIKKQRISPEDAQIFRVSIDRWINEELKNHGLEPTDGAKRLLRNLVVHLSNYIIDEI